jgi:DTW domain-containing protein
VSRRHNAHLRCTTCRMHGSLCVCSLIPTVDTRTRLLLVMHHREARKPSNTGRLAALCLPNSEVVVRGHREAEALPLGLPPLSTPVFLYPHEDARPLSDFADSRAPITLIVPDGTWRQASKVRQRVPGMRDVQLVSIPNDEPSMYQLRTEAHESGLATIEAIARAMGILEGLHVRRALEHVFRAMVERTLWSRGEIATQDVTGGVPGGAMRHDPRSGLASCSGAGRVY